MSAVSRRYAQALCAVLGDVPQGAVLADLETFGEWLGSVPGLKTAIANPGIPHDVKVGVVEALAERGGFQDVSKRFILLVIQNKRLDKWDEMVGDLRALCDEAAGVVRARVVTAKPVAPKVADALADRLGKVFGKSVLLEPRVSKELLGGIQLKIGSTVYDGSIAGALNSLRQALVKG